MHRYTRILAKPVLFTINCNPLSETKAKPTDQQGLADSKFPVKLKKGKGKKGKSTKVRLKCNCESHVRRACKIRVK